MIVYSDHIHVKQQSNLSITEDLKLADTYNLFKL